MFNLIGMTDNSAFVDAIVTTRRSACLRCKPGVNQV
jgi:hypothetical protein